MKNITIVSTISIFTLLFFSPAPAEIKDVNEMTVVLPADSIAKFIRPLLPYSINMGENFSGSFWVKSIENIKITQNRVSFLAHIHGKDIGYAAKIGKQTANFKVGNVDLRHHWLASLRYDKSKKKLYLKPHVESPQNKESFSQGDILIDTLFTALSDIEYPIDITRIKPITTNLYNTELTINMNISDVYAENNMLIIEIIPTAQKKGGDTK